MYPEFHFPSTPPIRCRRSHMIVLFSSISTRAVGIVFLNLLSLPTRFNVQPRLSQLDNPTRCLLPSHANVFTPGWQGRCKIVFNIQPRF
ncbi:hypothetical protein GALMADRAFT_734638 [Galerina marginata CBS 339.88]|uniref:Uncharacterized protein n=1 Tax=Galerina marginata (strain CBS 339.88) TaxID=685588 RepID=A0A067SYN0_GALM3|nr:hypothetical protein GALMADRAFT_734638 [Galerina marginata CBS 339.88]